MCSIIKLATIIAFDETSSYLSAPKSSKFLGFSLVATRLSDYHWSAFRNHEGSTFTEKDRNKLNKASHAIQSPRNVPFFLLVSLLDGYSFPNVLIKGIVAFKH